MNKSSNSEHLSPWANSNGWSFDPQAITVITRKTDTSDYLTYSGSRKAFVLPDLSTVQVATLILMLFSLGLMAALATLIFT